MALTQKQENFCLEYIKCGNASEAYRRAYNAEKMKDTTITERASRLLKEYNISARIKELGAPAVEAAQVSAKQVIEELARIAFFDVGQLYNEDGTLKEMTQLDSNITRAIHSTKQRIEKQGQDKEDWAEIKEIRTHDKLKALELLGKTIALFTDKTQTELSGAVGVTYYAPQKDDTA